MRTQLYAHNKAAYPPEKLVTRRGNVSFGPSCVNCPVCGEKMRQHSMGRDGGNYDFRYECPKCESDIWIETMQL